MKAKLLALVGVFTVAAFFAGQEAWASEPSNQGIRFGSEEMQASGPGLEKLVLGDGVYMPRFIGEEINAKPEKAGKVAVDIDQVHYFQIRPWVDETVKPRYSSTKEDLSGRKAQRNEKRIRRTSRKPLDEDL